MAEHAEHIVPPRTYVLIYVVLLVCTYLTWQVAYFDLGPFNTIAALAIAVFKASLVVLFFMHVKYSRDRLTWIVIASGLFWLAIMLALTMGDYLTRGWMTYG
jgi:cytochrome c oxidase subunit 4